MQFDIRLYYFINLNHNSCLMLYIVSYDPTIITPRTLKCLILDNGKSAIPTIVLLLVSHLSRCSQIFKLKPVAPV